MVQQKNIGTFNVDPTTIERLKLKMVKNAGNAENI